MNGGEIEGRFDSFGKMMNDAKALERLEQGDDKNFPEELLCVRCMQKKNAVGMRLLKTTGIDQHDNVSFASINPLCGDDCLEQYKKGRDADIVKVGTIAEENGVVKIVWD